MTDKEQRDRLKQQELVTKAKRLFQGCYDARRRYDWEWLSRDLFRRGYQFSRYNNSTKTVVLSSTDQIRIPINLLWAQMRIIKNQVTSFRPKWEVVPSGLSQEAATNARYSGKLLDYLFDKLNLRSMIKETVIQGLMYSVGGPWEVGYDPDGDNGNGEVYIWLRDTYDFYMDPIATSSYDAEYCFTAVRRPLEMVKNNPHYNFIEPLSHGESRLAASEYKQFLIQALKMNVMTSNEGEDEGVILKELWVKIRVNKDNKADLTKELTDNDQDTKDLRLGETLIRVVTYLDIVQDPLRVRLLRTNDFPFELYRADTNPMEFYGESWAKHVIPMNRVLNALESSVFEYNYKYAKGRLVIDKQSGVRIVTNRHGDIIEKNPGAEVTSLPLQPLPQSYELQINNMIRYIEDIGGAHDISFGRIPTGIKSGTGIAELKTADSTNQQDLVDNLEDFLVRVGKKVLRVIAENYDVPKIIKALGKGGDAKYFAVVGESGKNRKNKTQVKIGADVLDLAVIGRDNEVRVSIGSWLAYTKSAQQDKLQEYYQIGLIDQKTALENMEFGDIDNVVKRTREEELLKKYRGTPAQEGMPSDEEIAEQENFQMIQEGKTPEALPEDEHNIHIIVHQEALGLQGNPIVEAHIDQHMRYLQNQPAEPRITPALPEGEMGMGQPEPTNQPQTEMAPPPTNQPSPEEMALMQSIQGMGGMNG